MLPLPVEWKRLPSHRGGKWGDVNLNSGALKINLQPLLAGRQASVATFKKKENAVIYLVFNLLSASTLVVTVVEVVVVDPW